MAATRSTPSTTIVFQGVYPIGPNSAVTAGATGNGTVVLENPQAVNVTAVSGVQVSNAQQLLTFSAEAVVGSAVTTSPLASIAFWFPLEQNTTSYTPANRLNILLTPVSTRIPVTTISSTSNGSATSVSSNPTRSDGPRTTFTASQSPNTTTNDRPEQSYSVGTLAGATIGCAAASFLLAILICVVYFRRKRKDSSSLLGASEKREPLLDGHGKATYIVANDDNGWQKHLPQSDSDSTIRATASRVLDQIAMHVENFYTSKTTISLSAEKRLELSRIRSLQLAEPSLNMFQQSQRTQDLIKHYISSQIVSMIDWNDENLHPSLLPTSFRQQRHNNSNSTTAFMRAHTHWRILTTYLQQQAGNEQAFLGERDAVIETTARTLCQAFEPWAQVDEATRLRNLMSIMKRASELGIQLFAQPARFEWQWNSAKVIGTTITRSSAPHFAAIPGLYKTTDQMGKPLADPLRLVEPLLITFSEL